jgi:WD repeat-containing protein 48
MDVPPLDLPPHTEIVLAEETALGQKTIYRGTVESTSKDVSLLEHTMPLWLLHYLLTNRSPAVPNIKISFGVAAWLDNVESSGSSSVA